MCGNTKQYKYCHQNVWKHKRIQILSLECVQTQNWYKYCHQNVWKHKTIQTLSPECVQTQNWYKYCHRNVPGSSPFLPNQSTLKPAPNTTPPAAWTGFDQRPCAGRRSSWSPQTSTRRRPAPWWQSAAAPAAAPASGSRTPCWLPPRGRCWAGERPRKTAPTCPAHKQGMLEDSEWLPMLGVVCVALWTSGTHELALISAGDRGYLPRWLTNSYRPHWEPVTSVHSFYWRTVLSVLRTWRHTNVAPGMGFEPRWAQHPYSCTQTQYKKGSC